MKRWGRRGAVLGFAMVLATSGCAGAGGGGGGGGGGDNAISVLMVNNPQMVDLQKLTADNFTKQTGITVNYTVLPENDVRDKISQEFSSQAGQYDVASLSQLRDPDLRQERLARADGRLHRQGRGVQPGRHPQADGRLADRRRRQDLRRSRSTASRRS